MLMSIITIIHDQIIISWRVGENLSAKCVCEREQMNSLSSKPFGLCEVYPLIKGNKTRERERFPYFD